MQSVNLLFILNFEDAAPSMSVRKPAVSFTGIFCNFTLWKLFQLPRLGIIVVEKCWHCWSRSNQKYTLSTWELTCSEIYSVKELAQTHFRVYMVVLMLNNLETTGWLWSLPVIPSCTHTITSIILSLRIFMKQIKYKSDKRLTESENIYGAEQWLTLLLSDTPPDSDWLFGFIYFW